MGDSQNENINQAKSIVQEMLSSDPMSQWLGIELLEVKPGLVKIQMKLRKEMLNGFSFGHGGVTFSLADSAIAFAANTRGKLAVSTASEITFLAPTYEGDILTAIAEEQCLVEQESIYLATVSNTSGKVVAKCQGKLHRRKRLQND